MTIYSVYLPPMESISPPTEGFRLVPDKKSPWALIAPMFWLLYHRLWLVLLAYLVITGVIFMLFSFKQHVAIAYLSALPGVYLLLEGQELVRGRLEQLGWRFGGVVEAENAEEAEIRYLVTQETQMPQQAVTPMNLSPKFQRSTPAARNTNFGMFPE